MVTVLLAPFRVSTCRLDVAVGLEADPHVGIGRWDRELADALQRGRVAHGFAVRLEIDESLAHPLAPDAALVVGDVCQAGGFGRIAGVDDSLDFGLWLKHRGISGARDKDSYQQARS